MLAINSSGKIDESTNWDAFQNNLKELFDEEWHTTSNDVNQLWNVWKNKANCAAKCVMKKAPRVKNYKNFWDKDLDRMLKSRRETNQLQRLHNKHWPRDSELGQNISDLYRKHKKLLHDAIKRKESHNKMIFLQIIAYPLKIKVKTFGII